MDRSTKIIAKREIRMRLHSGMFIGMFASFVLLIAAAPWVFKFQGDSQSPVEGVIDTSNISILFVVYGILISSCTLLSYGLIEERASAVIDVLVSSVKPEAILKGKIYGITFLTLAEMMILSLIGYISSTVKTGENVSFSPQFIALMILFLAPAIAITSYTVAAISFRVKKIEEMGILQLPLLLTLAGCLFMGVYSMFSPLSRVGEFGQWIPVASSFVAPVLYQNDASTVGKLVLSLLIAGIAGLVIRKISTNSFMRQAVK